jgi:hypothetical protein
MEFNPYIFKRNAKKPFFKKLEVLKRLFTLLFHNTSHNIEYICVATIKLFNQSP